jgi:hypothetical protein
VEPRGGERERYRYGNGGGGGVRGATLFEMKFHFRTVQLIVVTSEFRRSQILSGLDPNTEQL